MPPKRTIPPKIKAPTMKTIKTALNKDAQLSALHAGFKRIPDGRRNGGKIPLADILMSGYAVFDLKDPSLLAFDNRRLADADNLQRIYGIGQVACDTQLRTILDRSIPICCGPASVPWPLNFSGAKGSSNWPTTRGTTCSALTEPVPTAPATSVPPPAWSKRAATVAYCTISSCSGPLWSTPITVWSFPWRRR